MVGVAVQTHTHKGEGTFLSRYLPKSFFGEKELGGRWDEEILTPPTQKSEREESGRGEVSYGGHPSGGKSPMFVAKLWMEIHEYEMISRTGCFLLYQAFVIKHIG